MTEHDLAPALPDFLAHGGATAALINARDWRDTQLGELQRWPNTLKSVLSTVLGSPKPMYVLWGAELVSFFNDAYAPILGKHLDGAMGRPFAEVWPELWADFEPMLRQALRGQGSTYENMPLTLARYGYPEPTWWTFSFLPLRDARGTVFGVHCICMEMTAGVRAGAPGVLARTRWRPARCPHARDAQGGGGRKAGPVSCSELRRLWRN